ncbi:hypothetical protein DAPPUDRAFT_233001 [Daphnia pulex]|uniref:Uncharacterized protein n=1 Tax=Daphnia pulex TaxID=6669 RepID=E9FSX4_DAPPU|nr:hypothetical protein DAPPUDRAFT_233001 [Daphnia pulex]|eukprot:EFX89741.1 hypothetical protein DAPPUDRAFT_233001 [Daphnia pulex]
MTGEPRHLLEIYENDTDRNPKNSHIASIPPFFGVPGTLAILDATTTTGENSKAKKFVQKKEEPWSWATFWRWIRLEQQKPLQPKKKTKTLSERKK